MLLAKKYVFPPFILKQYWVKQEKMYPVSSLLFLSLHGPYFPKVSVWEINDHSAAEDDSLHKDDIELISEMLQNWLFDVYR